MYAARFVTLSVAVTFAVAGCAGTEKKSDHYQRWSDYFECKARKLRRKEAERRAAKEERKRVEAECSCCPPREPGTVKETAETEVRFLLENDLSLVDYNLDFEAIQRMAKRQAKLDENYDKARKAWEDYEDERRRRHEEQERARARAEATAPKSVDPSGCGCVRVTPSCAYPPPTEYVRTPPPKRRAIGLEEIPIVIRANARFDVGDFALQRSRVRQDYQPGKQPCCPRCGVPGCQDRCDSCGYRRSAEDLRSNVPPAPAAVDELPENEPPTAQNPPESGTEFYSSAGLF